MGKLIIVTERDCSDLLKDNKVYPIAVYTDLDRFSQDMIYFENVHVVFLFRGLCGISVPRVVELYARLKSIIKTSGSILSVDVLSDVDVVDFKTRYLYEDCNIRSSYCCNGRIKSKKNIDLFAELNYEKSEVLTYYNCDDKEFNEALYRLNSMQVSREYQSVIDAISKS